MNILKQLFAKFNTKENAFFNIQKTVITNPDHWSKKADAIVDTLTDAEIRILVKICDIMQQSIIWHAKYLFKQEYTLAKVKSDLQYPYKSYFELTMFNWLLISNFFKRKEVKAEMDKILWLTIYYSFSAYEPLFNNTSYKNFEAAFDSRISVYANICQNYFKPVKNDTQADQNLFELIIDRPLSDNTSDSDMRLSFIRNIGDLEKMHYSIKFNEHFSKGLIQFNKQLEGLEL